MPDPAPIDAVRLRYPLTPEQDEPGLEAHAQYLDVQRGRLNVERIRNVDPAMTFDPRGRDRDE